MKTKQLFRFKIIFIAGLLVLGAINFIFTRPIWAQTILRPEIVFRSEWGAEDAKDWPPEYAAVKKIIIHHTGAEVDSSFDSKTVVKNLYFGHSILNAWGDIGYNYIISKEGRIFEGRAGGNGAIGAHAMGFNTGSIGIALIGDYNSTMPTEAAMNSLKNLVSWLVWENNLDPRGVSDFRGKKDVPTIAGHNDVNFTNCPGHNLQILLPSLRQDVAEIISRFPAKNFNAAFSSFPTAVIEFGGGEEKELVFQLKNTGNILWTNYQDNALGLKLEGTGDWQNDFFPIEKANLDPNDYSAVKVRITAPFLNSSQDLKFRIASKDNSFLGESQTLRVNVTTPTFKAGLTGMTSSPITSSLSQAAVSLKIKNLGSTSWEKGDAQLVLGEGRIESLLKTNTWVSREIVGQNQTRILSGETLGFDFTFAVPETPKNECFDFKIKNGPKLISGICWQVQKQDLNGSNVKLVSDIKIVKEFSKNIKDYQALYLSQSPFLTVAPGEISNLWVEFKNLGPEIWDASFFRLGTSRPLDRESSFRAQDWLSSNRIAMIPTQVLPGEVARFSFFIRAPETPGNFKEYFSLVADGVGWLPDIGLYWEIKVEPGEKSLSPPPQKNINLIDIKGEYQNQSSYPTLKVGETASLWVEFKNTGNTTWTPDLIRLATTKPQDRQSVFATSSWLSPNRIKFDQNEVPPGSIARFSFTIKAPETPGNFKEYFSLVADGVGWLPDIGLYWEIKVEPRILKAEYQNQSSYPALDPGELTTLWVEFKNTGNTTWTPDLIRLATTKPQDRQSVFATSSWLSPNRIKFDQNEVPPGSIARFSFTIKAPETPGNFKEYFSLVADGVGWLPDIGLYWEIAVGTPIDVTGNGKFSIVNGNGKILGEGNAGQIFSVYYSGSRYFVRSDNFAIDTDSYIRFVPQSAAVIMQIPTWEDIQPWYPNPNDNKFRGTIEIRYSPASSALWAIDELPLEDYLKGVAETGDGVPQDFAKALVLAERSYAYYHWSYGGRHPQDFLTLKNSRKGNGDDQVFKGYGYEIRNPGIIKAIEATKGELVVFNNEPVITPYFSQSDGRTRSISEVWGSNQSKYPHLVGVPDPYCQGLPLLGHGVGMSAYGALKMAENGRNYSEILNYYYTGTSIKKVETANILIRVGIYKINI